MLQVPALPPTRPCRAELVAWPCEPLRHRCRRRATLSTPAATAPCSDCKDSNRSKELVEVSRRNDQPEGREDRKQHHARFHQRAKVWEPVRGRRVSAARGGRETKPWGRLH